MKYAVERSTADEIAVAPHWGVWIEIGLSCCSVSHSFVAPHWGAWIEIVIAVRHGVKPPVAPHWGAWIEMSTLPIIPGHAPVAPHWGAWIEMKPCVTSLSNTRRSHPTGVRGLKSCTASWMVWRRRGRTPLGCVD